MPLFPLTNDKKHIFSQKQRLEAPGQRRTNCARSGAVGSMMRRKDHVVNILFVGDKGNCGSGVN